MAQTAQATSAQEAGRPQPQTTVEASGGPFIRHSQPGYAPQYVVTGTPLGGIVTQPLVARPGYFRGFRVRHDAVGAGTTGTFQTFADVPYALNALVQLKDAFGTPLIVAPGFEATGVVPVLSGGFGSSLTNSLTAPQLPSFVAPAAASGTMSYSYQLPLEFAKAYGVLSAANASLLPTLQFNLNASGALFSAAPTVLPTVTTTVDTSFYWLPEGVAVEPPGLGTTRQWILQQANPTVASASSARVQFPRLGGFLDTIAVIARDTTTLRNGNVFPNGRLQLYVDGVPMIDQNVSEWYDDMTITWGFTPTQLGYAGGLSATAYTPTITNTSATTPNFSGILAVSRKLSLGLQSLGLLDTGEAYLSTNPGTLLELNFAPAGTFANGPATLNVLVGQIVPTGAIIQGLPEV